MLPKSISEPLILKDERTKVRDDDGMQDVEMYEGGKKPCAGCNEVVGEDREAMFYKLQYYKH